MVRRVSRLLFFLGGEEEASCAPPRKGKKNTNHQTALPTGTTLYPSLYILSDPVPRQSLRIST